MQNTVTDFNNSDWYNCLSGMNDQFSQSFLSLLAQTFFVHNTKSYPLRIAYQQPG